MQLSFYSLSHTIGHLEYCWSTLAYLGFEVRIQNKIEKAQGDNEINVYNKIVLQVSSCLYVFIASFVMHVVYWS